jgi:dihydrofolate synthase/folylpolyglutamate synthase
MRERFRVNGEIVSKEAFLAAFEAARKAVSSMPDHPSYFEFIYLIGCLIFKNAGVDTAVMETGLGGRLDATNTCENPVLTIITSVSFDHMQYLGNTLFEIAGEKAGIIKQGVPVVFLAAKEECTGRILEEAALRNAPALALIPPAAEEGVEKLLSGGEARTYKTKILKNLAPFIDFSLISSYDKKACDMRIRAAAAYQAENASLAILGAAELARAGFAITEENIRDGLLSARWEGRMEEALPGVYLDGAHNEDGISRFIEAAKAVLIGKKATLLFAAVSDKDYTAMVRELAEDLAPECVITTEVPGARRESASHFEELFRENGDERVVTVPDPAEAFKYAMSQRGDGVLFVCGSLYLIGLIKRMIHDQF